MKTLKWHINTSLSYRWAGGGYFIVGGIVLLCLFIKANIAKVTTK